MTAADAGHVARLLNPADAGDARLLADLRADPSIEFRDSSAAQQASLQRLRPALAPDALAEPVRLAYYPWRRSVVTVLGPRSYRRLRLDRNRNLITADEQDTLGRLRIGVIGLSSGHVVAHTLAMQGLCGELRLADLDELELSNLNRIPGGVFDLGVNKTTVAARRIAELDPYLDVRTVPTGVGADDVDEFLDGLDVLVEECDSLDVKVLVRLAARARRVPVLMATSDRGLVDVERFDLEPDRPIFHGLLGDIDPDTLAGLSSTDKVPYVLRLIEVGGLSARAAASLLEVGHAVTTWPQLAGDVTLGAGAIAEAVRRIGLGEPLSSGRTRLDAATALDRIRTPSIDAPTADADVSLPSRSRAGAEDRAAPVVAAALRAPSGGNVQPWQIASVDDAVTVELSPERTSTIDVGLRGSAVAVGAAVYNARVAAAAGGVLGPVEYADPTDGSPLRVRLRLVEGIASAPSDVALAGQYDAMMRRETNRRRGDGAALSADVRDGLVATARESGAHLRLVTARDEIAAIAEIFSAADRIRYLTTALHGEMISELRWPGDADADTGIDVRSLELGPRGDLALDILRRADVMAELSSWDGGVALGEDTVAGLTASSAVAVLSTTGASLQDYARGGSAVEATWIRAQEYGLAVAPISPPFIYATNDEEIRTVAPGHADELAELRSRFLTVVGLDDSDDESLILVLRLSVAPPASIRSRRRGIDIGVSPLP